MQSGYCTYPIGLNGSPCKHQRLIWANLRVQSQNFLPYFSKEERQKYAYIAYGQSLPLDFYEGLHDRVMPRDQILPDNSSNQENDTDRCDFDLITEEISLKEFTNTVAEKDETANDCSSTIDIDEAASAALDRAVDYLKNQISRGERSLGKSIIKFSAKLPNIPVSNLPNCFFEFGKQFDLLSRKSKKRPKITVQVESQKRRKKVNGSRQQQDSGRKVTLKIPIQKSRRKHQISQNIRDNVPVCNKAGIIMASRSRNKAISTLIKKAKKEK